MRVRIQKLEERKDATHPNNINVGFTIEGKFTTPPTLLDRFYVGKWSTSIVTEIINDHMFKTLNSIYRWEKIQEK